MEMHYIDHIKNMQRDLNETTLKPDTETANQGGPINWVPIALVATGVIVILILLVCCLSRTIRDLCISCCFVKRGDRLMTPSKAQFDPKFNSEIQQKNGANGLSGIMTGRSVLKSSTSQTPKKSSSPIAEQQNKSPTSKPQLGSKSSRAPTRQQIISTVKTQKYIGSILTTGRRSRSPTQNFKRLSKSAPSASVQVARTQKIIGNILTQDNISKAKRPS